MSIIRQVELIRQRIASAADAAARHPAEIRLVAVSKTRSVQEIGAAFDAGVVDFGENYLQEAVPKLDALAGTGISWHFIGAIQANKTKTIATHFDWVQTLDRSRIAERLARQRPSARGPLNVLIQVNIDREPDKAGVQPEALAELIAAVSAKPQLRLRGLMAIPRDHDGRGASRDSLARMAMLFQDAKARPDIHSECWDTLSMGMTNDFPLAIAEGASMVRIGTGIFGPRPGR